MYDISVMCLTLHVATQPHVYLNILCKFSMKTFIKIGPHNLTRICVREQTCDLIKLSKEKCHTNVWNFQSAPFTI